MRILTIVALSLLVACGQPPILTDPVPLPSTLPSGTPTLKPVVPSGPPNLSLGHIDPPFVIPRLAQDPRVTQYITDFENTYPSYTTARIPITFVDYTHFPPNVVAQCHVTGLIEVNQDTWGNLSKERQRNMIYHELGHCLFRRPHSDERYPDNCPKSIMNTYLIEDGCLAAHPELIDELARNRGF